MKGDRPLFWFQGLFLQPQHLQLTDRHYDRLVRPLRDYLQPYFWGVISLSIQEMGLSNKTFEVSAGEFMFPDGTHVTFPGNAALKPRSFDEAWLAGDRPFTVYLGLRKWNPSGGNVTVVSDLNQVDAVNTRYAALEDPEEVLDLHGDGPPALVKHLSYALRIFWETEEEELDDYHLIAIGRLERDGEVIRLSREFLPPCLTLNASEWLMRTVKDVRDQITSRCRQLEDYKSPKEVQSMEFDIGYLVFLLALRSLNRYVPVFYQISETENLHPWPVYGVLRQMVGELSTFSEGLSATGERDDGTQALPPYDHQDLWTCFSSAAKLVGELLDGITVGPGHRVRLEFDGSYFTGELSERMLEKRNRYWLMVRTEADPDSVIGALARVVKLSAKRHLSTLLARAVPGIPLEYYPTPPPGLPRRPNTYYFRIDHASPLWPDVVAAQNVSLFWDTAPGDVVVEILILGS
ncbi:MAG: type VI secretion system baseplate subunit TssK [Thermodesulfobacteriota bacterium]